jgi:hypothetical protein
MIKTLTLSLGALGAFGITTIPAVTGQLQRASGDASQQKPRHACSITLREDTPQTMLSALARVSPQNAIAAATATGAGTVTKAQLETENGCLLYSFDVRGNDGRNRDVKVDAGTGRVVYVGQPSMNRAEREGSEGSGEAENEGAGENEGD